MTRADLDKNAYHTDVYVARDGQAGRVTWSLDAGIVLWEDENTLILRRSLPDAAPGQTELFRLSMNGGEAQPWVTLDFFNASADIYERRTQKAADVIK